MAQPVRGRSVGDAAEGGNKSRDRVFGRYREQLKQGFLIRHRVGQCIDIIAIEL